LRVQSTSTKSKHFGPRQEELESARQATLPLHYTNYSY